jgi:hypothetical protein
MSYHRGIESIRGDMQQSMVPRDEYDPILGTSTQANRVQDARVCERDELLTLWFSVSSILPPHFPFPQNKRDLFADKCQKVSLSVCFPDYTGDDSYDAHFIQEQFETKNRNPDKQIYTHLTAFVLPLFTRTHPHTHHSSSSSSSSSPSSLSSAHSSPELEAAEDTPSLVPPPPSPPSVDMPS